MSWKEDLPKTRTEFWILKAISTAGHILLGVGIGAAAVLGYFAQRNDFDRGMKAMEMIVKNNPGFCLTVKQDDRRLKD